MVNHTFPVITKQQPTFYFIGVTTGRSSIMRLWPEWMSALGRPEVRIEGVDLALHDHSDAYRRITAQIKYDPLSLGALVTTHKIDLLSAARDLFDYLDSYAEICGEVSSLSKQAGRLEGHAKDPISAGLSLDALLGPGYFERTGGDVLCLGAGGSCMAIALHLIYKADRVDRPRRFIAVNRSQPRLDHLAAMVASQETDIAFDYILNEDPVANDALLATLPVHTLVINATGMGKDRPGSPLTDAAQWPQDAIAWELNYRGELDFMHQALAQQHRGVRVEDGWLYFLHGWTQVIAQVLHTPVEGAVFSRLAEVAAPLQP